MNMNDPETDRDVEQIDMVNRMVGTPEESQMERLDSCVEMGFQGCLVALVVLCVALVSAFLMLILFRVL
jgi:hypothetical protein